MFGKLFQFIRQRPWAAIIAGLLIVATTVGWFIRGRMVPQVDLANATYVGRSSCVECHQSQCDAFIGSHHDKAMDLAKSDTVLGAFDGTELEHFGITSRFYRSGEKYMVHTEGADGQMRDFEVKYVFGVEPLQQYMVETKPASEKGAVGTLQVLRLSWDTQKKKWFYLSPPDVKEKIEPGDPLHWTGITQNWNSSCAFCHSTNLRKNFHSVSNTFNTRFSEIDVSCEACHGPASEHVRLAQKRNFLSGKMTVTGLHRLKTGENVTQVQTCAPCHSRRDEIAEGYRAGCNYDDYFQVSVLHQPLYHCDGQIRDEVYVYGSYIQSKMFHNNIRCTDCHDPHTAKLKHEGNRVCTSCHQHPAAVYDTKSHHQHEPGSAGAQCVNCHMPATTYMDIDSRRDHSLRVPRPDLSVQTGSPNACTGCHLDKSKISENSQKQIKQYLDWLILRERNVKDVSKEIKRVDLAMKAAVEKWYGKKKRPEHYGKAFHQSRTQPSTTEGLKPILSRRSFPDIVRATAAFQLAGSNNKISLDLATKGLSDENPMVVRASLLRINNEIGDKLAKIRSMDNRDQSIRALKDLFDRVVALTQHKNRTVRIESARTIVTFPLNIRKEFFTTESLKSFQKAFEELVKSHLMVAERGSAQRALGSLYNSVGELDKAIEHYRNAIRIEPELFGSRLNLAVLLDQKAQEAMQFARQLAQTGSQQAAQSHALNYQRLAAEVKSLRDREHEILVRDVKRLEGIGPTAELDYQLGMSFYRRGNMDQTEFYLRRAYQQFPRNEDFVLAMATFYQANKNKAKAFRYVSELLRLNPNNPGYQNLLKSVNALQ